MDRNQIRSGVSVGEIDWDDPYLSSLLEKTAGWRLDNRSGLPPQKVQIHIRSGLLTATTLSKPALLVSRDEDTMVLVTRFPIQLGEHIGVDSLRGDGTRIVWGSVVEGRQGRRAEDSEHDLFLTWLRLEKKG
jgi:hypothetical protein